MGPTVYGAYDGTHPLFVKDFVAENCGSRIAPLAIHELARVIGKCMVDTFISLFVWAKGSESQ